MKNTKVLELLNNGEIEAYDNSKNAYPNVEKWLTFLLMIEAY